MFEIVAFVFIVSLYIALLIAFTLLVLRLFIVIKDKPSLKASLAIVLIPGSIGYYYYYKDSSSFKTWYQRLVIIMFVLTFIGSIYLAFLNIPQFASWFFYGF